MNDSVLAAAAAEHETPLFVYDLDEMTERVDALRSALPPRVELAYAVKANPALALLRRMAGTGVGADVASAGELAAALRAGFPSERIVITGPGKRDPELASAAGCGLRAVTVESLGELQRLRTAARRQGVRPAVLLRAAGGEQLGNVIGAGDGRFGMRRDDLAEAATVASAAPELDLAGIHRFDASNLLDADELLEAARQTVAVAAALAAEAGVRFRLIDIGGGLGIPYRDDERPLDLTRLGDGLAAVVAQLDGDPRLAGASLLLEPGRYLVGPIGAYLVRVLDVKEAEAGRVATVDGGVHHLLRPALIGQAHRVRVVSNTRGAEVGEPVTIGGPLYTGLDVLARRVDLPCLAPGDLLAIGDAGAYGFTESMPLFLSHPTPAEVVVEGGVARLARPRIQPEHFLDMQVSSSESA
jgi:diaminopimelate decarboxylase